MRSDVPTSAPTLSERAALVVLQVGTIAVVLAAAVYKQFELDRFFVPKELVLHVVATVAALCCLARSRALERKAWRAAGAALLRTRRHLRRNRRSGMRLRRIFLPLDAP